MVKAGIRDTQHKPREAEITDDAKAWVVNLACSKPKDLGYAAELWTRSALARHVRQVAVESGFPALAKAGKATVQRILTAQTLQPHKVKYYLEKRDPEFDRKMKDVLLVYREVALRNEALAKGEEPLTDLRFHSASSFGGNRLTGLNLSKRIAKIALTTFYWEGGRL